MSFNQMMRSIDEPLRKAEEQTPEEPMATVEVPAVEPVKVPEDHTVATDTSGVKVAKPIVDVVEESVPTPKVSAVDEVHGNDKDDPDVVSITAKVEAYLKFNTGTIMSDPEKQKKAGDMFRDILFFGVDHPSKGVLDVIYRFFRQNRDKILAPQVVLPSTLQFKRDVAEKVHCVYTLFRGLAEDKPFRLNLATTRVLLHTTDNAKVDALLTYFESKQK